MIRKTTILLVALCCLLPPLFSQNNPDKSKKVTLSGYLRDAASGEELLYARVAVEETGTGAVSNEYGYYSLTLPPGSYTIRFSYVGYIGEVRTLDLQKSLSLDIELGAVEIALGQANRRVFTLNR